MGKIDRPSAAIYRLHMVSGANSATDERGSVPIPAHVAAETQAKEPARAFLQSARRDLSDDELATPAARRFLIVDLERLDDRCAQLQSYEQRFHDQRVTIATLTPSGYAKVVAAAPGHVRAVRELVFDPLTKKQVEQLRQIAGRIEAKLVKPLQ